MNLIMFLYKAVSIVEAASLLFKGMNDAIMNHLKKVAYLPNDYNF